MKFTSPQDKEGAQKIEAPFLLVGLGNPGSEYTHTRHNVGAQVLDTIFETSQSTYQFSALKKNFKGIYSEGTFETQKIYLLKPLTYMNLSGESVGPFVRFYKIPLEHVLVIQDELDLPLGSFRLKKGGGHGGHNGLKSLSSHIGNDYWRLRIGIGHPGSPEKVTPYVLSSFTKNEAIVISALAHTISEALSLFFEDKKDRFIQTLQETSNIY